MIVVGAGFLVYSNLAAKKPGNGYSPQPTRIQSNAGASSYAILKPADVPPKIGECSQTLSYASNGDPSPISCANGDLNILDWQAVAALEPTVMKLGYSATQAQIQHAICVDGNVADADSSAAISAPIETNAYEIASLYYGWKFNINPSALLLSGC